MNKYIKNKKELDKTKIAIIVIMLRMSNLLFKRRKVINGVTYKVKWEGSLYSPPNWFFPKKIPCIWISIVINITEKRIANKMYFEYFNNIYSNKILSLYALKNIKKSNPRDNVDFKLKHFALTKYWTNVIKIKQMNIINWYWFIDLFLKKFEAKNMIKGIKKNAPT
mgnify:CR=1 FL=1